MMLKRIRVTLAVISMLSLTMLFLDFTGVWREYFGWLAKIQFVPAILALNVAAIVGVIILTLLLGRVYCSVVCPLGIMQDVFTHIRGWFKIGGKKKNRFTYMAEHRAVRWSIAVLFIILLMIPTCHMIASLIEPYSEYGRIVSTVGTPIYDEANNLLADVAEKNDSMTFYTVYGSGIGMVTGIIGILTLIIVGLTSFLTGREYCNTICPVGTVLGFLSRFSLLKPWIDTSKCNGCGRCARNCKARCIDAKGHIIDYSRCVTCMDCLENCTTGAIRYGLRKGDKPVRVDNGRRAAMTTGVVIGGSLLMRATDEKIFDGGLATIIAKELPGRQKRIVPPGAISVKNLTNHCTGCQLCIVNCPNEVLRPSTSLTTLMQPMMEFEKGYCRPECNVCSQVCPVGAIKPISLEDRTATQVGVAVVDRSTCLSVTEGKKCGNCSRHCPVNAIEMVVIDKDDPASRLMPVVNESVCIGCGACENLCPVNPISAIHVEGREVHLTV